MNKAADMPADERLMKRTGESRGKAASKKHNALFATSLRSDAALVYAAAARLTLKSDTSSAAESVRDDMLTRALDETLEKARNNGRFDWIEFCLL